MHYSEDLHLLETWLPSVKKGHATLNDDSSVTAPERRMVVGYGTVLGLQILGFTSFP